MSDLTQNSAMELNGFNIDFKNDELRKEREALDLEILSNERIVNRFNSLQNLLQNKDFIDVFLNGFIKEKSEHIFSQLLIPEENRIISKAECDKTLDAISMLNKFIGYGNIPGDLYYQAVRSKEIVEELKR